MKKSIFKRIISSKEFGIFIPWLVICIVTTIANPAFASVANIVNLLRSISITLIGGVGVTFIFISGQMEMSIGSTMGLASIITGMCLERYHVPVILSILAGLGVAALIGLFNGFVVSQFGIPALIVTLGTMYIGRGMVNVICKGVPFSDFPDSFIAIGNGNFLGIPFSVYIAFAVMIIGSIVLKYTVFGRSVMAIGGNRETARLSGIHIAPLTIATFMISSVTAGIAGILQASRLSSAQANAGTGWEMTVIAAVVIGGTSMFGGAGSMIGTLIGAGIMETLTVSMTMLRVDAYWQKIVVGAIIIIAVGLDTYRRSKVSANKG